jgi:tyrosyl-tRNA synthetase
LQRDYGQPPQIIATTPLLEGLDGVEKMSKSKANYVGITEPPADMFRKLMNMPDALIWRYYELLTDVPHAEIEKMRASVEPLAAKTDLAKQIVSDFHSPAEGERVAASWGKAPPIESLDHFPVSDARLNRVLVQARFAPSVTEADKLIKTPHSVAVIATGTGEEVGCSGPAHRLEPGDYIVRVGKKFKHVTIG